MHVQPSSPMMFPNSLQTINANPDAERMSIALVLYDDLDLPSFEASYSTSKLQVFFPLALMHLDKFPRPAKNSSMP